MKKHTIYVLSGVAGSGKSTWAANKDNVPEDAIILSSDDYREKLLNGLEDQSQEAHRVVFDTLHKDLREILKSEDPKTIVFDATMLTSKLRRAFYNQYSCKANITVVMFYKTLANLLDINENRKLEFYEDETGLLINKYVPTNKVIQQYNSQTPPVKGVECDNYIVNYTDSGNFVLSLQKLTKRVLEGNSNTYNIIKDVESLFPELKGLTSLLHNNPHHQESVFEHIAMTMSMAPTPELRLVAFFHDLGKAMIYQNDKVTGIRTFKGHEAYGAKLAFLARYYDVAIACIHHMTWKKDINLDKFAKRRKLTPHQINLLDNFNIIDARSRWTKGDYNLDEFTTTLSK